MVLMKFFLTFQQKIKRWTEKQIFSSFSTIPFAIFRVGFGCVILGTIWQIFEFKALIFDVVPFYKSHEINIKLPLFFWMLVSISLILGFLTKWMSIANFVFALCFVYPLRSFGYAFDTVFLCVSAWMLFAPIHYCFSLDSWIRTRVYKKAFPNHTISLYVQLLILLNLTWVYVDAGIQKVQSELWLNGIAFWRYASIPSISTLGWQALLNHQILTKIINYAIILFQLFFPILLIFKKIRWIVFWIGVSLHLSILLFFPIKLFSVAECLLYIFLIPNNFWNKFHKTTTEARHKNKFAHYYIYFQIYVFISYAIIWTQNPFLQKLFSPFLVINKPFLGIVQHYLFIDELQKQNNFTYSIVFLSDNKEIFLPVIDEEGKPDKYLTDRIWSHWDYVSNSTFYKENELLESSKRFIAYWIGKQKLDKVLHFKIKRKPLQVPSEWKPNIWTQNLNAGWQDYYCLKFENGIFELEK
ncbi:MAG: hypothetical protein OHK0038_08120 [Flammeovirgaceae bacterium]